LLGQADSGFTSANARRRYLAVYEELRAFSPPSAAFSASTGASSLAGNTVHDSTKGVQRIQAVVPDWRFHLWPNSSHAPPAEIPDEVNVRIRQFVIEH
jgi:hypothetical protein